MLSSLATSGGAVVAVVLLACCFLLIDASNNHHSFSYDPSARNGPDYWGDLNDNSCKGDRNSPIALNTTDCAVWDDYVLEAGSCTIDDLQFELLCHVVEAVYPDSNVCTPDTLQIPGVSGTFEMIQFHIHASSEHSLDGEFFHAELHLVHKRKANSDEDRLAVIGIFIVPESEEDNAAFDAVLNEWESDFNEVLDACSKKRTLSSLTSSDQQSRTQAYSLYSLIPQGTSFYHYHGSLTTPPCSEIVDWNVADTPLFISMHQYYKLNTIILNYLNSESCELASVASPSGSTSRPIQPHNNRTVRRICSSITTQQESVNAMT